MVGNLNPDEQHMREAIRVARKGLGKVSPNPMVGAVVVKEGRVIGTGSHLVFGGSHAEVVALKEAGAGTRGATLYVTLEPCSYQGKTPACTEAVIHSGVGRVAIGGLDPNPRINGQGVKMLRESGIEVITGILRDECEALNLAHNKLMRTGLPFATLKFAQTLDGRIATSVGESRWISSESSRRYTHRLRSRHDAVMVGIGTVLADDPRLDVRMVRGRSPIPVVLDSHLRLPLTANLLGGEKKAIVITTPQADISAVTALEGIGSEVIIVPADQAGRVDMACALAELGKRQVSSVMVEGGAGVITALLRYKLADRLVVFIGPSIMGRGVEAVGDLGIGRMAELVALDIKRVRRLGRDIVVEAAFTCS
ncbi:bifunctional diaminohydroxyphosphoribosylaminopyrimidine deaminase/5-amino-6-(5-phosphoribosylamino)uracil reductase RibD [Chloroflexota bacterium]